MKGDAWIQDRVVAAHDTGMSRHSQLAAIVATIDETVYALTFAGGGRERLGT